MEWTKNAKGGWRMKKVVLFLALFLLVGALPMLVVSATAEGVAVPCYVTANEVRERETGSITGKIICEHDRGEIVEVIQMTGEWWQLANGHYMYADYLIPVEGNEFYLEPQIYYVATKSLRERSGPSTNDSIVGGYSLGEAITVIGEERGWYHLENGNYVCGDYVVKTWDEVLAKMSEEYGDFIVISISQQFVEYYADGEILTHADCVTGDARKSPTPAGVYQVYYKNHDFDMNGNPYNHVRYFTCFYGGIGVHDAPWRNGKFGGTIYQTNGSHGCINTTEEAAEVIYNNSKIGTYVIVLP